MCIRDSARAVVEDRIDRGSSGGGLEDDLPHAGRSDETVGVNGVIAGLAILVQSAGEVASDYALACLVAPGRFLNQDTGCSTDGVEEVGHMRSLRRRGPRLMAVSYTHLTLPT